MRPIKAKALWMVLGNKKNVVFIQMKSGRVIINSAEEFSVAANKFVSSTVTLFQKKKRLALRAR